jgi:hypothetical protein
VAAQSLRDGFKSSGIEIAHFSPNLRPNHQLSPGRAILIYKIWKDFEQSQAKHPESLGLLCKTEDRQYKPAAIENIRNISQISSSLYVTFYKLIADLQNCQEEPFSTVYKDHHRRFNTDLLMMPSETVESDLLRGVSTATNIIFRSYNALTQLLLDEASSTDESRRTLALEAITSEEKFKQFIQDCARLPSILALTSISTINSIEDSMYVTDTILKRSFTLRVSDGRFIPETSEYGNKIIQSSIHHTYDLFTGCPAGYSVKELNSHLKNEFGFADNLLTPHTQNESASTTLRALLNWGTQAVSYFARAGLEARITEQDYPLKAG